MIGDDIQVTARPTLDPCDQSWGVEKGIPFEAPKNLLTVQDDDMREWIKKYDAASIDNLSVKILVAGSSERVATLTDVKIEE
jgi:hypothetical protein